MDLLTVTVKVYDNAYPQNLEQGITTSHTNSQCLCDSSVLVFTFPISQQSMVEKVIHQSIATCGISPMYMKFFALRHIKSQYWINPNSNIVDFVEESENGGKHTIKTELRIRFIFKTNDDLQPHRHFYPDCTLKSIMKENVICYLFHQHRADYLEERLTLKSCETNAVLKRMCMVIAASDILRLAFETNCDLGTAIENCGDIEKLFPKGFHDYLRSRNIFRQRSAKHRFANEIKKHVKSYTSAYAQWCQEGVDLSFFCNRYIQHIHYYVDSDFSEVFMPLSELNADANCNKITISSKYGIMVSNSMNTAGEKWCDFNEKPVADLTIQVKTTEYSATTTLVTLSQMNGQKLNLYFSSLLEAENLVSCIDGYYQLLTDTNHYLCKSLCLPSLVEESACFCYGPISIEFAKYILEGQSKVQIGDCLIRQSRQSHCEYFINTVTQVDPIEIKNFHINRENGFLGIFGEDDSYHHPGLLSFLNAYKCKSGAQPIFNLNRLVHPSFKQKSELIICLDSSCLSERPTDIRPLSTSVKTIMQTQYSLVQYLGHGKFTDIRMYSNNLNGKKVVVKQVFDLEDPGRKQHIDNSFQDSIQSMYQLHHAHIVQLEGKMSDKVVLEYLPLGSIIEYFNKEEGRNDRDWRGWFLHVLWQFAHACNYLEWKRIPHGNIRGKNILLACDLPTPTIKLADMGVCTYREFFVNYQAISCPVLPAPWLAYEFCKIDSEPKAVEPTITGDKWSFATTVCEISDWGKLNDVKIKPRDAYNLSHEIKLRYKSVIDDKNAANVANMPTLLRSNNTKDLVHLIQECWNYDPTKRPLFKVILRELGAVIASDAGSISPLERNVQVSSETLDTTLGMPSFHKYDDEHLVRVEKLGKGNFGSVDLFLYEDSKNGTKWNELVAVKTFHQPISRSQMSSSIQREFDAMKQIDHPYVVKLKGTTCKGIVMEYLLHGSLTNYLIRKKLKNEPLSSLYPQLLEFASQISQGMIALQKVRVIHRDLALRNILLGWDPSLNCSYAKISDFGLSKVLSSDHEYYKTNVKDGPLLWYAPECLQANKPITFSFESDVWSFGVTLWEMFSYGKHPNYTVKVERFADTPDLLYVLQNNKRLPSPEMCPEILYELMLKCWKYEPRERMKFDELHKELDEMCKT